MSESTFTNEEWSAALQTLIAMTRGFAQGLRAFPLDDMLRTIGKMETLAPILEPTAYQRGGMENLDNQRKLLQASKDYLAAIEKIGTSGG